MAIKCFFQIFIYRKTPISIENAWVCTIQNLGCIQHETIEQISIQSSRTAMEILIQTLMLLFKLVCICYFINVIILKRKTYDAVNWYYKLMYHDVVVTYTWCWIKGFNGTKGVDVEAWDVNGL